MNRLLIDMNTTESINNMTNKDGLKPIIRDITNICRLTGIPIISYVKNKDDIKIEESLGYLRTKFVGLNDSISVTDSEIYKQFIIEKNTVNAFDKSLENRTVLQDLFRKLLPEQIFLIGTSINEDIKEFILNLSTNWPYDIPNFPSIFLIKEAIYDPNESNDTILTLISVGVNVITFDFIKDTLQKEHDEYVKSQEEIEEIIPEVIPYNEA